MKKNNKIKLIITAMLVTVMMASMLALSACSQKDVPTPIESEVSSETSSVLFSEPVGSDTVSEITSSENTSSEVVSEPTGSVNSVVESKADSSKVESKVVVSSKPEAKPKPVSSQSAKVENKPQSKPSIPVVDELPSNAKDYDVVMKGDNVYNYLNGQWWSDGEIVDDSDKTYPPCDVCGQPQGQCTCRVGY